MSPSTEIFHVPRRDNHALNALAARPLGAVLRRGPRYVWVTVKRAAAHGGTMVTRGKDTQKSRKRKTFGGIFRAVRLKFA